MERNDNRTRNDAIEIDIVEIVWRLLSQWKVVILFSLLCGILFSLLMYYRDVRNYKERLKTRQEKENTQKDTFNSVGEYSDTAIAVLESLEEEDQRNVLNVLRSDKVLQTQKNYYENSIYLNMDANNVRQLSLQYLIDCPDKSKDGLLNAVLKDYTFYLRSNEVIASIKEALNIDGDNRQVLPLISFEDNDGIDEDSDRTIDSIKIIILLPYDNILTSKVEEVITDALQKRRKKSMNSLADHNIKLVQTDVSTIVNDKLLVSQTDWTNRIADLTTKNTNNKSQLIGSALSAYEMIKENERGELDVTILEKQLNEFNKIKPPRISKKKGVIGVLLGGFLYVAIYMIYILICGIYYSPSTLVSLSGGKMFGHIHEKDPRGLVSFWFNSGFVNRIRYKNQLDPVIETNNACSSLASMLQYKKMDKLTVLLTGNINDDITKYSDMIVEGLCSAKIDADAISLKSLSDHDFVNMNNCLLFVPYRDSNIRDISRLQDKLDSYDVKNIGAICFDYI